MTPLFELTKRHGQQHLLRFWDELSPKRQAALEADIRGVDFSLLERLLGEGESVQDWAELARRAESPPAFRLESKASRFSPDDARRRGVEALSRVGVVIVAGGQGARLGFHHPKGMFRIGPVSNKTLFQILFEKTIAIGRQYGVHIPIYLMTSPATHDETAAFLAKHGRFGLPEEVVILFCQGTMPAADLQSGKLLLAEKHRLFLSPDGTGGILDALINSGALRQMRSRGLDQLFYMQVDNPLANVCDPEFLGYHLLSESELSTLVVAKESPLETLGNVVSIDGQVRILEYSDLNRVAQKHPEIAERRQPDGTSVFWAGNLGIHAIGVDFLERIAGQEESLPFHIAKKKVSHLDPETGQRVDPVQENAVKFERFIFDFLPQAREAIVVEVDKFSNFAPLKNKSGADKDTPEAVQSQMTALHSKWLQESGVKLEGRPQIEICPLFAMDARQFKERIESGHPGSGITVTEDRYFADSDGGSS